VRSSFLVALAASSLALATASTLDHVVAGAAATDDDDDDSVHNYLCAKPFAVPNATFCRPPREEWDFFGREEFVITAWWPPSIDQLDDYVAAHFNLLNTGNLVVSACQTGLPNASMPSPGTDTQVSE
jgi:hypothetical protein